MAHIFANKTFRRLLKMSEGFRRVGQNGTHTPKRAKTRIKSAIKAAHLAFERATSQEERREAQEQLDESILALRNFKACATYRGLSAAEWRELRAGGATESRRWFLKKKLALYKLR